MSMTRNKCMSMTRNKCISILLLATNARLATNAKRATNARLPKNHSKGKGKSLQRMQKLAKDARGTRRKYVSSIASKAQIIAIYVFNLIRTRRPLAVQDAQGWVV